MISFKHTASKTVYGKPDGGSATWGADTIAGTPLSVAGAARWTYVFVLPLPVGYTFYEQLGGAPDVTDTEIYYQASPRNTVVASTDEVIVGKELRVSYYGLIGDTVRLIAPGISPTAPNTITSLGGGIVEAVWTSISPSIIAGQQAHVTVNSDRLPKEWRVVETVTDITADSDAVATDVAAKLGSDRILRLGPGYNPASGSWELIKGNDHVFALNGHTDFELDLPGVDLALVTAKVGARSTSRGQFDGVATIVASGDGHVLRIQWPKENLADACPGDGYMVHAKIITQDGSKELTKASGPLVLYEDSTAEPT